MNNFCLVLDLSFFFYQKLTLQKEVNLKVHVHGRLVRSDLRVNVVLPFSTQKNYWEHL